MRSVFEKSRIFNSTSAQMLITIIAFAIMGFSSFFFAANIERKHMINGAKKAIVYTEAEIVATLIEAETFLSGYSEIIRSMIIRGEDEDSIQTYMTSLTNFLLNSRDHITEITNTHGYFYNYGKYLSGSFWTPPASFTPQNTPWYKGAVEAEGRVSISEPYTDAMTGRTILTFSRHLYDNENNPLGVICLDIEFVRIFRHVVSMKLTENGYGILMNKKFKILAHPEPHFIGGALYQKNSGLAYLADELEQGFDISERKVRNYMHDSSVVFFQKIKYGWYLGIVIPVNEYYSNTYRIGTFLFVLGSILAAGLCIMLYRIFQAKKKSDQRTHQKSNFLATMSHEIRTPLNAIMGMTEIQMQSSSHPPATSEVFIKINNSGNLLLGIINDILGLSKIEAGKLELTSAKYEVASLINDVVQLNHIRYDGKPIEFKIKVDADTPSVLVGDELRIKQILNNLLSNSFKYTDSGEIELSASAECVARGGITQVTLIFKVTDTGHGMTPEQVNKLFDESTRFNLEINRTTEGTGLGMTITRNLINLMNGKISVKSIIGEGTTVTVRLPQKTDGIGVRGVIGRELADNLQQFKLGNTIQLKKTQIKHEYMPYGHVLIVDDVETNLYVAKGLMTPYGLNIELATSGFEAIDKIKEGAVYDIVFMDHMMPKLDGMETTKKLREMRYHHPVVALTANAISGQAEIFLNNGFDGFISKPIDIRQLNFYLNKLIRDKQSSEVIEAARQKKTEIDKKQKPCLGIQQVDSHLAEIFARDAEKAITVLETVSRNYFKTESDIQSYVINVHAMKSALANIGESELSAAALRLEQAGREKNINVMLSETLKFLESLHAVIVRVKPKEEEDKNFQDTEESLVYLREKLIFIKEACSIFDKKSIKNTLNELRDRTWSYTIKEMLNTMAEHLLHSDFDNVIAIVDEYI